MTDTILTSSQRNQLLSLRRTMDLQAQTTQRLSTGLKVNSAFDNPSSYFEASALQSRARTLTSLMDNVSQGLQTIKAASEAISNAYAFLEQAKTVASNAIELDTDGSTTPDIPSEGITKVATKQELLDAVNSWQTGDNIIMITEDIVFDTNENLDLSDKNGIKIVGENYAYGNQKQATLTFNFNDSSRAVGIDVGTNTLISDLKIDYTTQTKSDYNNFHAISNNGKQGVELQNLTISANNNSTGNDLAYGTAAIGNLNKGQITLKGDITISNLTSGSRSMGLYGDVGTNESTFIQEKTSTLNIQTKGQGSTAIYRGNNILNGTVNISTNDVYGSGIAYGNNVISGNLNIRALGSSSSGLIYGNYDIKSTANVMINTNGSPIFGTGSLPINIDYEAGATIGLAYGTSSTSGVWNANSAGTLPNASLTTLNGYSTFDKTSEFSSTEFNKVIDDAFKDKTYSQTITPSTGTITPPSLPEYGQYVDQFNEIISQFNNMIGDASYKGINLLEDNNELSLRFNEDNSSNIVLEGRDSSSTALGISDISWQNAQDIELTINQIDKAVSQLQKTEMDFANDVAIINNYQNFNEKMVNVLKEGADKLTLADMNEEMATMLALQTREAFASMALNISAQSQQNVLLLFGESASSSTQTIPSNPSNVIDFSSVYRPVD